MKKEQIKLEHCKKSLIIDWDGSNVPPIDERFYYWCMQEQKPYIRVQRYRKYVDIFLGLPNTSCLLDAIGASQFREFCVRHGCPEAGNTFLNGSISGVPPQFADRIAESLVLIALGHCRRLGKPQPQSTAPQIEPRD